MPPENTAQLLSWFCCPEWKWPGVLGMEGYPPKIRRMPGNPVYRSRIQDLPVQEAGSFLALCLRRKVFYSAGCCSVGRVVNGKDEIRRYPFGGDAAASPETLSWHRINLAQNGNN